MAKHELHLIIQATRDDVLMMRMTVSGLGMLAGLDVGLIGDLRMVTNECCECLMGRADLPERIELQAAVDNNRLTLRFAAVGTTGLQGQPIDSEIASGILSTLMPEVHLQEDELGIVQVICSMPVGGDGKNE